MDNGVSKTISRIGEAGPSANVPCQAYMFARRLMRRFRASPVRLADLSSAANGAYWRRHEGGGHRHRRVCAWSHNGTPHAPGRRIHGSPRGNVRAAARGARTSARERRRRVSQPQRSDPRNQERWRRTCAGLCRIRHRQGQTYLSARAVASLESTVANLHAADWPTASFLGQPLM